MPQRHRGTERKGQNLLKILALCLRPAAQSIQPPEALALVAYGRRAVPLWLMPTTRYTLAPLGFAVRTYDGKGKNAREGDRSQKLEVSSQNRSRDRGPPAPARAGSGPGFPTGAGRKEAGNQQSEWQ